MKRRRALGTGLAIGALLVGCGDFGQSDGGDATPAAGADAQSLPVRYAAARYFLAPVTTAGDTVVFYTDTGGGANMIWPRTVDRLGLEPDWTKAGKDSVRTVPFPTFRAEASIPAPAVRSFVGRRVLLVYDPPGKFVSADGFLGRLWFAERVWEFDYPGRSLSLLETYRPSSDGEAHRIPLGFQTDTAGERTTHFPRIAVEIAGDSLDLLFDTGATVTLTDSALRVVDDGRAAERGASFITRSVYEQWRERHPDWRSIEGADQHFDAPLIEVPRMSIAGHSVGPVWFTVRPDPNFRQTMSKWMDREIDGALGGSGLRFFRVIVDYPNATALFIQPNEGHSASDR